MFNSFIALKNGNLARVDTKLSYPLLRWCSSSPIDLPYCNVVNRYLFWTDKKISIDMLWLGLKDKNTYIKYPKATKEKLDRSFELKKQLLMKYYKWSDQEFERNLSIFDKIDWNEIAVSLGCDNKERKLLGIQEIKFSLPKRKPLKEKNKKSLFDF